MNHKPQATPKLAVNAIIFDEKKQVLLAKRTDNGIWCIPGGHVDLGETLVQACLRELLEETGLKGEVIRLVGVYSDRENSLHIAQGPEWHTARVSFLCKIIGGRISLSDETSEIQYFDVHHLPTLITDHAQRIRDAYLENSPVIIG